MPLDCVVPSEAQEGRRRRDSEEKNSKDCQIPTGDRWHIADRIVGQEKPEGMFHSYYSLLLVSEHETARPVFTGCFPSRKSKGYFSFGKVFIKKQKMNWAICCSLFTVMRIYWDPIIPRDKMIFYLCKHLAYTISFNNHNLWNRASNFSMEDTNYYLLWQMLVRQWTRRSSYKDKQLPFVVSPTWGETAASY